MEQLKSLIEREQCIFGLMSLKNKIQYIHSKINILLGVIITFLIIEEFYVALFISEWLLNPRLLVFSGLLFVISFVWYAVIDVLL